MKERVYSFLTENKISYAVTDHNPVYTMEDMIAEGLDQEGTICKNLFIRDAKGKQHFLITADNSTKIDLKSLGEKLGAGKVSFASPDRLEKYLGVSAGCVSPFGVLNDESHSVIVVLDQKLQGQKKIGVHPNEHDATVWISFADLSKVLKIIGNEVKIIKL